VPVSTDPPQVRADVPLGPLTTIGVGGPAARLVTATTTAELLTAVREADARGEPLLLLGGGSNVVVADAGFDGLVVLVRTRGRRFDGPRLTVAAGEPWDALVDAVVAQQLAGIECLAGIPGLAGATPVQNVGAYGQEVAGVITGVHAYDRAERALVDLRNAECGFGYRSSRFKAEPGRWVVTAVDFLLRPGERSDALRYGELSSRLGLDDPAATAPLVDVRDAVLDLRRGKGMVLDAADPDTAGCGSFFTNPVLDGAAYAALQERVETEVPAFPEPGGRFKVSAAWLIDRAGFPRGYGSGAAALSSKHPLAITNRGGAHASDVIALAREIRDGVRERLGVTLVNEPVLVGLSLSAVDQRGSR
jgi:UDP-N-acetylmuramate dehydrogenase